MRKHKLKYVSCQIYKQVLTKFRKVPYFKVIFSENLLDSSIMSKETLKSVKPVRTRPGTIYGLCKVHKQSALQTTIYNLVKFLVPKLNPLTKIKYTVVKIYFNLPKNYLYLCQSTFSKH